MLKISALQVHGKVTLQLEGCLSGAWVSELEDAWQGAVTNGSGRTICIDLARVCGIDAAGRYLLLLIHERGGQMIGPGGKVLDDLGEVVESWRLRKDS